MKTKMALALIPLFFGMTTSVFADQCVAFINYSSAAVEVTPVPDPGGGTIIPSKSNAILSGDRRGTCMNNNCVYLVSEVKSNIVTYIENVPPGSAIVYGGKDIYYVDKNANVLC